MSLLNLRRLLSISLLAFVLAGIAGFVVAQEERNDWARRDAWQRPAEVMDKLGIQSGSVVADVGAGTGYFTFHLASRVGPRGKVYAEDVEDRDLKKIKDRAADRGLVHIETILGTTRDPRLPADSLDAILVVNAYHEMREYDAMLSAMFRALKPGGRLAILDQRADPGESRERYQDRHRISEELVKEDALRNGLRFSSREPGFKDADGDTWFFLLFDKPRQ